jgi:hypothetical protein
MPRKSKKEESISETSSSEEETYTKSSYKHKFQKLAGINDDSYSYDESDNSSESFHNKFNMDKDCDSGDCDDSQSSHSDEYDPNKGKKMRKYKFSKSDIESSSQKKQKQQQQKLNTQQVVFSFNVGTSSKKKSLKLDFNDLKIMSVTSPKDFETLSENGTKDKASKNADVILKFEFNMDTDYPGTVKVDFPTIKCLYNRGGFQGEKHISHQYTPPKQTISSKKPEHTELINRELAAGQIEFLKKYPGHTSESVESFCTPTPNKKFINVGLKNPNSCIMHFLQETIKLDACDKQSLYNKNIDKMRGGIFQIPKPLYDELIIDAKNDLEKNFSFSDVTSKDFHINITPQMRSTTQKNIQKAIITLAKSEDKEDKRNLRLLKKEGFSNFYNTNPEKKTFDAKLKEFEEGIDYAFTGTIKVTYYQIRNIGSMTSTQSSSSSSSFSYSNKKQLNAKRK